MTPEERIFYNNTIPAMRSLFRNVVTSLAISQKRAEITTSALAFLILLDFT
jgi:hypothetical protein